MSNWRLSGSMRRGSGGWIDWLVAILCEGGRAGLAGWYGSALSCCLAVLCFFVAVQEIPLHRVRCFAWLAS